jgi:hypothetical protein
MAVSLPNLMGSEVEAGTEMGVGGLSSAGG